MSEKNKWAHLQKRVYPNPVEEFFRDSLENTPKKKEESLRIQNKREPK